MKFSTVNWTLDSYVICYDTKSVGNLTYINKRWLVNIKKSINYL